MKISKKDLSLLLYVLALVFVVGGIWYGNKLSTDTEVLETENAKLQSEVAYLQDLTNNKQEYLDEIDRMNGEMEAMKEEFPAKVLPEDQIMYANELEAKFEVMLDSVDMPGIETIAVEATPVATATTTDTTATTDATATDATATDATATDATAQQTVSSVSSIVLSKAATTFSFQASYPGLKDFIKYINEDENRRSFQTLTVGYDSSTGNLTGTFTINMYALDGTGKEYNPPKVTGVTNGKTAIFTGVDKLNRSTQGAEDVAVPTDTEASEEEATNE